MRIFCATMIHETSSFSPIPTSLESFRESVLYRPSTGEGRPFLGQVLAGVDLVRLMQVRGHEPVVGLIANAEPSAPPRACDYHVLRDEILSNLERALPVDAVFLFLHGAQMAQGIADCESDLLVRVRRIVGPDIPIAVELDLHCNIGDETIHSADVVLACLEYPHIDFELRAHRAVELLEGTVAGRIRPITVLRRLPLLGLYPTTSEPMRGFVDSLRQREGQDGILAVSLGHGFTGGDTPLTGASVVVVADADRHRAEAVADEVATAFWRLRHELQISRLSPRAAIERALASPRRPVVIADASDNPGGGAAGDSTHLLQELLARDCTAAAVGMIWDPLAARLAAKAGVGSTIRLRLGGKIGRASGNPLDVHARVLAVNADAHQFAQGERVALGLTVAIEVGHVQIVVNSIRQQVFSPECFTELGIDPGGQRIVVVKSTQHFVETFAPIAGEILFADAPDGIPVDYRSYEYRHVQRPIWPLDPAPFSAFGRTWP